MSKRTEFPDAALAGLTTRALRGLAAVLCAAVLTAPAHAVTATDQDAGAAAWDAYETPTQLGADVTRIEGRGGQNDQDHFLISGIPAGAQRLTLLFSRPETVDHAYSAGGEVLWSDSPFRYSAWEGKTAGRFQLDRRSGPRSEVVVDLGDGFDSGVVHLALMFTHGQDVTYSTALPWAEEPGQTGRDGTQVIATPLPAAGVMMLSALALGAGLIRRLRAG